MRRPPAPRRSMINRLILWLSLAGMILALHLWIQKSRGFDQGCLGLEKPVRVAQGDCHEASELPASHLLGVSNAAWGYAFYFALALGSFVKILAPVAWARRLHHAGEAAVVLAAGYSGYLVYAMIAAEALCVLCLTSAAIIATLLLLHVWLRRIGGFTPVVPEARVTELGLAGAGLFAATGVLVGVLLFVDRLGTRPLNQGNSRVEFERLVGESLPKFIDQAKLAEMRACHFDWNEPPLALEKFIGADTPFLGEPGAIPVLFFADPNCPHCAEYLAVFARLAEKNKTRYRFTIVPRVLWEQSVPQVAALKLAERSGKYFELWRIMFERQPGPRKSMSTEQLAGIFRELGLEASNLEQRLAAVVPAVRAASEEAKRSGINSTPAIYVGPRMVWMQNRSEECMNTLLERVASGQVKVR